MAESLVKTAERLREIIEQDRKQFDELDRYWRGEHPLPFQPDDADEEYRTLARRSITNLLPLMVTTTTQMLYVDGFTKAGENVDRDARSKVWDHWHRSRLDAKQTDLYQMACRHGMAYTWTSTESRTGDAITRGLSARNTTAIYEYPASDLEPVAALTLRRQDGDSTLATMWDDVNSYEVVFDKGGKPKVSKGVPHGASTTPITRFAPSVDLEGRATGLMEPLLTLQDRLNQTVFDLLVAQTYNSWHVRTATGMTPPPMTRVNDEGKVEVVLDENGDPVPDLVRLSQRRLLIAESPDAKFGTLPGTPLEGYIQAVDLALRHMAVAGQVPPPYALGQIANLSAEALGAADTGQQRKVEQIKHAFGESMERTLSIAAELEGDEDLAQDLRTEVRWRDMAIVSQSQVADSLIKLASLGVPPHLLWERAPNVTSGELRRWQEEYEAQNSELRAFNQFADMAGNPVQTPTQPEFEQAV